MRHPSIAVSTMSLMGPKAALTASNCDFRNTPESRLNSDTATRPKCALQTELIRSRCRANDDCETHLE